MMNIVKNIGGFIMLNFANEALGSAQIFTQKDSLKIISL